MNRRILAPATLLAFAAVACGAGSALEEAAAAAFAERFPSAGEAASACLASGYLDELSPDELERRGVDAATLAADPGSVDELIGDAPGVVGRCVDLEERLAAALDGVDGELAPDCVGQRRLEAWPLVRVLLEAEPDLTSLTGRSQRQLLDAVRGCVGDGTLATVAGLDDPAELAGVLIADPFAASRWVGDQDRCVTSTTLTTLGIERLDELGVGLASPDLLAVADELSTGEVDRLVSALEACDLPHQLERAVAVTEPAVAPCAVAELEPDSIGELAAELYQGSRITWRRPLAPLLEDCVAEALAGLYPPPAERSSEVDAFIREFTEAIGETQPAVGVYQTRCLEAGLATMTDDDVLDIIIGVFDAYDRGELAPLDDELTTQDYMLAATEVVATCVEPWDRLREDLSYAGIDDAALPCIRAELDPTQLRRTTDSFGPAVWAGDSAAWIRMEKGFAAVAGAIESCATVEDVSRWARYSDELFDPDDLDGQRI